MPGGAKPIPACATYEIRAFLLAGTILACVIGIGSSWSTGQPDWFLWPLRLFCAIWLATLWYQALHALRKRKRSGETKGSEERVA